MTETEFKKHMFARYPQTEVLMEACLHDLEMTMKYVAVLIFVNDVRPITGGEHKFIDELRKQLIAKSATGCFAFELEKKE